MRVRIKELAQEAKFIKHEEQKLKARSKTEYNVIDSSKLDEYNRLRYHRIIDVRGFARASLIAYAFLKEKPYASVEHNTPLKSRPHDFDMISLRKQVGRLATKFGGENFEDEVDRWLKA